MTTLTFDTHAAFKAMRDAGASEPLAEAILAALLMSRTQGSEMPASKVHWDDPAAETDLVAKTELVDFATKLDLEHVKLLMTARLVWTALAVAMLAVVVAKLF